MAVPVNAVGEKKGHEVRLERDVLPHLDRLYSLALLMTGDSGDAEDLIEETFTMACASLQPQAAGTDPKAGLYSTLITTYRRRRRSEPSPLADSADWPPAHAAPNIGSGLGGQIEALHRLPEADIKRALHQLPEDVRIVVYLAEVEVFAYTEIAEIMGTSIPTVSAWLRRGRGQLRDRLLKDTTTCHLVCR